MPQRQTARRRAEIADMILSDGAYRINELAQRFGVSRETIRKDLLALEKEGVGQRGRNKFIRKQDAQELPLDARSTRHLNAKKRIAREAARLVPAGSVVLLDSGSTTYEIAKLLAQREGLTIITNSAIIPPLLRNSANTLISLGGEMRSVSMACVGMVTLNALRLFHADIAFIGASGCYQRGGPCSASYAEAEVKRVMIENAKEAVLVCDSSKFTTDCAVQFCAWGELAQIITDQGAPADQVQALKDKVKIRIVS